MIRTEASVARPVRTVWKLWTEPAHITQWCAASDDWHAPEAENDIRVEGRFRTRMEAKDGSAGFDFGGTYTKVEQYAVIEYVLDDGRNVLISFTEAGGKTHIVQSFDPEQSNPEEFQRAGWQSILDNFRRYAEGKAGA